MNLRMWVCVRGHVDEECRSLEYDVPFGFGRITRDVCSLPGCGLRVRMLTEAEEAAWRLGGEVYFDPDFTWRDNGGYYGG